MSCSLIVSSGGIYAILNGMSEQMGKSEVLEAGILCLRTLSVGKEGRSAIHVIEGLNNLISAMSDHPLVCILAGECPGDGIRTVV